MSPQLGFQAGKRQDDRRSESHVALPVKVPQVPRSRGQATKQEGIAISWSSPSSPQATWKYDEEAL